MRNEHNDSASIARIIQAPLRPRLPEVLDLAGARWILQERPSPVVHEAHAFLLPLREQEVGHADKVLAVWKPVRDLHTRRRLPSPLRTLGDLKKMRKSHNK